MKKTGGLAIILIGLSVLLLWALFRQPKVLDVILDEHGDALSLPEAGVRVRRGDVLPLKLRVCKHIDIVAEPRAWLEIGGSLIELDVRWKPFPVGCTTGTYIVTIPTTLSAESVGHAMRVRTRLYYKPTLLSIDIYVMRSGLFVLEQ